MKSNYSKKKCPLCAGTGKVIDRYHYTKAQRAKARKLYEKGIGLREIGREIGVNHPQKVKSMILAKCL